jgi:DNA-binding FadR family transcriptional regulator
MGGMQMAKEKEVGRGQTVLELIQELIIEQDLSVGDRLPTEFELAGQLGVSRNAVREALRALEALGIVEIRHGHGIYLREATLTGLAHILVFWSRLFQRDGLVGLQVMAEVREAIESSLIVKVMPLLTPDDLEELSAIVDEMRVAPTAVDVRHADRHFHDVLYRPLDNWIVTYLLDAFWEAFLESTKGDHPSRSRDLTVQQHDDIVSALKARDADALVAAMRNHFDNPLRREQGLSLRAGHARDGARKP